MTAVRGDKISMIFQDPMTALNPVETVGDQIAESLMLHRNMKHKEAEAEARRVLEMVGIPEARLSLAQAIIAVCESPKSNSVVMALDQSAADAQEGGFGHVPPYLRDTHYSGNERVGAKGAQYKYPHDYPGHYVQQQYLPDLLKSANYYEYGDNKTEQAAKQYWDKITGRKDD